MSARPARARRFALAAMGVVLTVSCDPAGAPDAPSSAGGVRLARNGAIAYTEFLAGIQFVDAPGSVTTGDLEGETDIGEGASFLSWSPDGRELAYVEGDVFLEEASISVLDVRTGDTRQLTKGAVDSSPIWSPDGSRIAFLRFGRRAAALWAMRADGTDAAEISASGDRRWTIVEGSTVEFPPGPPRLDPETILRSIAWSPDWKRIAFGIDPFGERPEIRIVSLDSETEPTTLQGSFPTWSPSGDRLCIVRATSSGSELLLVSPDGADEETFAAGSGSRTLPSWSPDGDRILFVSDEAGPAGNLELWVADIDGGDPQQLTRDATELGGHLPPGSLYPSWSPDGAKIVYLDEIFGGGAVDLWVAVVDADGGDPEIVTISESRWPDWQPLPPE